MSKSQNHEISSVKESRVWWSAVRGDQRVEEGISLISEGKDLKEEELKKAG
jgi:hypothetical protein